MFSRSIAFRGAAALAGSLALLAVSCGAATASFGPASGNYVCTGSALHGSWSPVSAGPNSFIIGNCAPGTPVRRAWVSTNEQGGPYTGGIIDGTFNGCGAVQQFNLNRRGAGHIGFCTDGRHRPRSDFAYKVDCPRSGACPNWDPDLSGDRTTQVLKTCQAYANVRPFAKQTAPTDPAQVISPADRDVFWRYITRDGKWVMVHHIGGKNKGVPGRPGATYVFVAAGCVTTPHMINP